MKVLVPRLAENVAYIMSQYTFEVLANEEKVLIIILQSFFRSNPGLWTGCVQIIREFTTGNIYRKEVVPPLFSLQCSLTMLLYYPFQIILWTKPDQNPGVFQESSSNASATLFSDIIMTGVLGIF